MAKNIYQSAQGLQVNIDQMRILNEKSVAVGNMQVNARGDQVSRSGEIIKSRNEIMKDHYSRQIQPVVQYNHNKRKQAQEAMQEEIQQQVAAVVAPVSLPPVGTHQQLSAPVSSDLRGSLASEISVDLTEPAPASTRTIRRI
jgi:type IV secretory pathway VirJ component